MSSSQSRTKPLWVPDPVTIRDAPISKFMRVVNKKYGTRLSSYQDLHSWSTAATTANYFWSDVYEFLQLSTPGNGQHIGPVLEGDSPTLFPPPRFFPQAKLNIAEHILRRGKDDDVAVHFVRETVSGVEAVTWGQLRNRTRTLRDAMISHGVDAGDVVAAVISNSVDAMAICLAALSLGAIWSSASCELGSQSIVERFSQVKPKLIFADDGYWYGGKLVRLEHRIRGWSNKLAGETLIAVVVVPYCNLEVDEEHVYRGKKLHSFLATGESRQLAFRDLPFHHPAFILYSSGTTGAPKCIVHSAGGVLLKVKTDSILQHGMRETDVIFQYTTTAWVMWVLNFVNLSCADSMMLYDGSPFHPRPGILFELAADLGVTIFGTSPRFLTEIRAAKIKPKQSYKLDKLRVVTSTGAVLSADLYKWFYEAAFPQSVQLISMSGGTDIAGSFVGGSPILPVYAGEIQAKALGIAVDIFDASKIKGEPVEAGSPGELVCIKPFPSQPLEFLGPQGNERYRKSYFERFGNSVWCQGDFIQQEIDTRGLIMLGRSDGVLNPSGVRFGSAEIYAVTEMFPELEDSICVGQRRQVDTDERVLLFVKLKPGQRFSIKLIQRLKLAIRQKYSSRHVPKFIFEVTDIPYTVNGKKCEINVKQIVSGQSVTVSGTVANPRSLDQYKYFSNLPADAESQAKVSSHL